MRNIDLLLIALFLFVFSEGIANLIVMIWDFIEPKSLYKINEWLKNKGVE